MQDHVVLVATLDLMEVVVLPTQAKKVGPYAEVQGDLVISRLGGAYTYSGIAHILDQGRGPCLYWPWWWVTHMLVLEASIMKVQECQCYAGPGCGAYDGPGGVGQGPKTMKKFYKILIINLIMSNFVYKI